MRNVFIIFMGLFIALFCSAQEKELLIIGTMHTVPKIVKNSYKPLLDYTIEYKPEAIYVEYIHPDDTLSMDVYTPLFLVKSDSLKQRYQIDEEYFIKLKNKKLSDLTEDDFYFLSQAYFLKRDKANYMYYKYLSLYGIGGADKPLRNENDDLTFKLAARMGITYLFPIDDHRSDKEYYKAWNNAIRESKMNDDIKIFNKLIKKNKRGLMFAALSGKLAKYTNDPKTLYRYYLINSFRFVNHSNVYTESVDEYWKQRNQRMAENIVKQIITNPYERNVLIVGAGHVISLSNALRKICPRLKVMLMHEYGKN